jgi:hypothetical protein
MIWFANQFLFCHRSCHNSITPQEFPADQSRSCCIYRFDADQPEREPQMFRRIKLNVDMSPDDFVTTQVPPSAAMRTTKTVSDDHIALS